MRSFQQRLSDFNARGLRIAAISADSQEDTHRHCQKLGFTFTFLSDPKAEVAQRYGLLHQSGGMKGEDIARPAEFLIDPAGTIRWVNLTESVIVRARPAQVLKAFDELKSPSPAAR